MSGIQGSEVAGLWRCQLGRRLVFRCEIRIAKGHLYIAVAHQFAHRVQVKGRSVIGLM